MFQLLPNKETGIGDCCHVDGNGQMDVRRNVCRLMCVVFWLWLNGKRSHRCYIWWKSGNPHFRWFLSLLQSIANGVDDGHCLSAMDWLGSPECGSFIIMPTIFYTEIEISGLHLSLLHDSLQREETVKLLAEWEVRGYYKYKYSSIFTNILCFLNVVTVSLSDHKSNTTLFISLVKILNHFFVWTYKRSSHHPQRTLFPPSHL